MSFCNGTNSINWTWGDKERNKDVSIMRCNREGKEVFKRERERERERVEISLRM